ncbi:4Fe-4S binding domain-containing protein [Persephonella hydrogeniphila]|uniref:4Fe-4S binding domain-containing protein n=1 Tax=Persephonella hydrogeniphila TaxID=198703 RepID=A0A285NJ28_9AQUI|nr:4Fe-4S binding protein [Persephonella hydrogeniphila]SNZ08977.1 4Fe-4S binding domain-containing protein [Persephonella hydrogeniphila]
MNNRSRVRFNINDCVHVYYKDSSCRECINICPIEDVLSQDDYKIILNAEKCVSCGACVGACPSEAFSLDGFELERFYRDFLSQKENVLSCKINLPCLTVLNVEYIVAIILEKKEDLIFDTGHCSKCFVGDLLEEINKKVEEANYILEKLGVENRAVIRELSLEREEKKEKERRAFLKNFGKAAAGITFWALMPRVSSFEEVKEQPKNIVEEKVGIPKRKILIEALKNQNTDYSDVKLEVDKISFTSDKWIDNTKCTNCSVCYNVCPTGALKAGAERLKILFEPKLCIKCKVCHDVCPEDCLHLKDTLNVNTFLNETEVLAEHVIIPCEECLVPFSYKGDTTLCPRCRELEDEIRDLLKIGE